MRRDVFRMVLFMLLSAVVLLNACGVSPQATPTFAFLTPTVAPSPSPTAFATIPMEPTAAFPVHRIGVRMVDGVGEFYDRATGEKFVPRGTNYIRVAPMSSDNPGLWHSTLNPGFYEPERAESALAAMHALGYNVVRIFVDCCRPGTNAGDPAGGVSQTYLANVIDFLTKARANEIHVLMVMDLTPAQGGYDEMWGYCCETFDGENLRYLTPGGHSAERRFNRDFIRAMIAQGAPVEWIFAYDLTNEVHFSVDQPPFSLTTGKVTTANHQTYDLSSSTEKKRMMDENLVYWIDQQRANILEVDPTALVTVSFPAINGGNTTVDPYPAISESTADFVDLHTYLGWGINLDQYMARFGLRAPTPKPVILGEFGAAQRAFPTAATAAQALTQWQVQSCDYGIDGWLLWTWDTDGGSDLYSGVSDQGQINTALAPVNRPEPCQMGNVE